MSSFTGKAITAGPIRALGAALSLGIVDALFMRAAQDTLRHDHRFGAVKLNEANDRLIDHGIITRILLIGKPSLKMSGLTALGQKYRRDRFAGMLVIRPLIRHGCHRVSLKALPAFLPEFVAKPFCLE